MYKIFRCFFMLVLALYPLFGSSQTVYFLQGQTYSEDVDVEGEDLYPVLLYALNGDSLISIPELSILNNTIDNIRMYYEHKKIIINYYSLSEDCSKYCFLEFNNQLNIKHHNVYDVDFGCYSNYLINKDKQTYLLIEQASGDFQIRRFIGLNYEGRLNVEFSDSDLQYYIGDGCQGFGVEDLFQDQQTETLFIKAAYNENNDLFYYLNPVTEFDKKYIFPMPNIRRLQIVDSDFTKPTSKYGQYQIKINTGKYLILNGKVRPYDGANCKKQYLIYNKVKNDWVSHDLKGSYPAIRIFGDWLVGSITDDMRRLPDDKKTLPISGEKYRKQERTKWGNPADIRFKELLMHPYGELFLYNLETGSYIEWEALENDERQADSEILYVENNMVIYRINSEIYSVEIINGEKLGQSELLIQDERVPYIHWAFLVGE